MLLNRFNLEKVRPNINVAMKNSGVCAITADDYSFAPPQPRQMPKYESQSAPKPPEVLTTAPITSPPTEQQEEQQKGFVFDKTALKVYKRIPEGVECSFEALAGDGITVSDVATAVLKLQVGGFVTVYPGDTVSRKFKS